MNKFIKIIALLLLISCFSKAQNDGLQIYRESFHTIDVNHDNCATLEEVKNNHQLLNIVTAYKKLPEEYMEIIDKNQDSCINEEEFIQYRIEQIKRIPQQNNNNDGCLEPLELGIYFESQGLTKYQSQQEINLFINTNDSGKDGCVNMIEYGRTLILTLD